MAFHLPLKKAGIAQRLAAVFVMLLFAVMAKAQPAIPGYTGLGTYNGHYYYISETHYLGVDINLAVVDAKAKIAVIEPGRPASQVYAAAIVDKPENDFIQNAIVAYNISKYGGNGKSTFPTWWDVRNPWIGLSDIGSEGNFFWMNGQPNCGDFRNWNQGEPNNFTGEGNNGEDFTQMLIMNPYELNGNPNHDPLGKWNDWFNQRIIPLPGQPESRLPVIIEVGPLECPRLLVNLTGKTGVSCYGEDNGTASFAITSGLAPFTYKLDDGEETLPFNSTTFTITDLEAGPHSVRVTDANGNTQTINFTIEQPASALDATFVINSAINCNGGSDASVTISATGGTAPYTGTGTFTGLAAGTYTYIVKDANNCQDEVTVVIGEPSKLVAEATNPKPSCNGSTGSVVISATGGTAPYTGTGTKTGLAPGSHTFTVTDANGCTATVTVVIDGSGTGGFNVATETFPNKFNSWFIRNLNNAGFVGSSGNWSVSSNAYATMVVTTPYYAPSTSNALKVVNFKTQGCGSGWTRATSPKLNLTGPCCPSEVKLNFTLWTYNVVANDQKAKLEIDFSSDGTNWTEVYSKTSAQLYTSYGDNGKAVVSIAIPASYHTANFRYRIRGEMAADDCNNFYLFIDDINITSPAECTPPSSIGNFVWNDVNANGKQDAGEPGLANVTVKLTLPDASVQTKTTDANGAYSFTGLSAGAYKVTFTTPSGFAPTAANQGDDALDSDPVSGSVNVTLAAGQANNTIDAGFKVLACTNTTNHSETFPNKFNTYFNRSLYNKTFIGSAGTWTVNSNSQATMVVTTPYYAPSTSYALKVVNYKTTNCGSGWTKAVSPKVDLSAPCCPSELKLTFTLWTYKVVANDYKAKLEIDFSNNNGGSWQEVWSKSSAQLHASYGAYGKTTITISVPAGYQTANFRYRIRGEMAAGDCNNFYVFMDDIKIGSPASCSAAAPMVNGRTTSGGEEISLPGESARVDAKEAELKKELAAFSAVAFPNPTNAAFELRLTSKETAPMTIRVVDVLGRTVKFMRTAPNQTIQFGADFRSGNYVVEVSQGERKEVLKLIKL